jgi:hypothetical protein
MVAFTRGTGYKQTRRIAGNTASDLTVEADWGVVPANGDTFEVSEIVAIPEAINPSEEYTANWNNKAATADEGQNFGREFRHTFILERLAAENAWDRPKQRQLNKDVAGLDGNGRSAATWCRGCGKRWTPRATAASPRSTPCWRRSRASRVRRPSDGASSTRSTTCRRAAS